MLHAVLKGKAARVEQEGKPSVSWRELFRTREDLLTAAVFGRFAYLSCAAQQKIMLDCLGGDKALGEFESIDFWPSYELKRNDKKTRVEPDFVMRFTEANVLVEIKPPRGFGQSIGQWSREVEAFFLSDDSEDVPLHFLALGQLNSENDRWVEELKEAFPVLASVSTWRWPLMVKTLNLLLEQQAHSRQDLAVLHDMLKALQLNGLKVSTFEWADFKSQAIPILQQATLERVDDTWQKPNTGEKCPFELLSSLTAGTLAPIKLDGMQLWTRKTKTS